MAYGDAMGYLPFREAIADIWAQFAAYDARHRRFW